MDFVMTLVILATLKIMIWSIDWLININTHGENIAAAA